MFYFSTALNFGMQLQTLQCLLEEKETVEEKLAISEYELRLAQEDISKLKAELQEESRITFKWTDKVSFPSFQNFQILFLCLF